MWFLGVRSIRVFAKSWAIPIMNPLSWFMIMLCLFLCVDYLYFRIVCESECSYCVYVCRGVRILVGAKDLLVRKALLILKPVTKMLCLYITPMELVIGELSLHFAKN